MDVKKEKVPVKNSEKWPKMAFRGTLDIHGEEKKNTVPKILLKLW